MKKLFYMVTIMALIIFTYPVFLSAMEYQHKIEADDIEFSWRVENDKIHVMLSAKTTGWVGIGFDPESNMKGADIIIGAVKKGKFKIEDHYGNRQRGHSSDKKLGGDNNVMNPFGSEKDGVTTISFTLYLDSTDKYDKPIQVSKFYKIMLAYGAGRDSFRGRHPYRTIYEVNLSTGENNKLK